MKCKKCGKNMRIKQNSMLEDNQGYITFYVCENCGNTHTDKLYTGHLAKAHKRMKDGRE